ncbi:MAG: NAD-binding protein [Bacilli bacterium]|mgnify:CR=1 FL=1|jgi:trk system potassium uptake protein TrkA|nr:NAD-binding protein [Bacilli bacterium]MCH4210361.1 NAD-binding protein [Bacilli bacterium]MCH4228847.1 NAD-binding protein [Bacilli bacterium]MCH4277987.1 NAD-binding protein [Bacilli bacterium]MCI2054749.1 NAD-binding protein [Bacilli bacterium]
MAIRNKTVILGCGRLGSSVANNASNRGSNVIVVDESATSFERLDDNFSGYKIIGDATDTYLLEEDAYIKTAREVIVTTGDDNVNLFLAHLCAIIYGVPHVFVRFDDPDKAALIASVPNIKAIYPFELSLNKFTSLEGEGDR